MKILRNKLLIGLLCIALGLAVVLVAAPAVVSEQTNTTQVCTAIVNIEPGTALTADMLKTIRMPADLAPSDATVQASSSIGQYATTKIWAGDVITAAKLTDGPLAQDDSYALATAKGKMVVSVTVKNLSVMAAARIQSGDVVMVMALMDSRNSNSDNVDNTGIVTAADEDEPFILPEKEDITKTEPSVVIYPELKYMEIAAIVASSGEDAKVSAELSDKEKNNVPVTISFYVTEEQAKRLADLEKNGTIYIAFVARGEEAYAFIPQTEKVLLTANEY